MWNSAGHTAWEMPPPGVGQSSVVYLPRSLTLAQAQVYGSGPPITMHCPFSDRPCAKGAQSLRVRLWGATCNPTICESKRSDTPDEPFASGAWRNAWAANLTARPWRLTPSNYPSEPLP